MSFDEIIKYSKEQWRPEERINRLDMLAELLYAEGSYKTNPLRDMLLNKAYQLFDYVETNGNTFSLRRRQIMREIGSSSPSLHNGKDA